MKCPDCGGQLNIKSDDSGELVLMCQNSHNKSDACRYVVRLHNIPVLENELQEMIDTAPQFLLSRNISRKDSP